MLKEGASKADDEDIMKKVSKLVAKSPKIGCFLKTCLSEGFNIPQIPFYNYVFLVIGAF
jgi:hypothetical protein